ncbi:MAG: hypothetical protein ABSD31_20020 [Candidatus Binataceae bacterium]|jgi:hypothetical protein
MDGIWHKGNPRLRVVMTVGFASVALLFIGLAIHQSTLVAKEHAAQIAKLQRRINNIIAGNKMTLDQISESLFDTPETEALEALGQLVDAEQVEADLPEQVCEVVAGIPRSCFPVRIFHHHNILRDIIPGQQSSDHDEGWMELAKITDLKERDELRLVIGGTAAWVLVQLLPVDHSPTEPYRMLGPYRVDRPFDRAAPYDTAGTILITLTEAFPQTRRITVFGGQYPLNFIRLGESNGPATLLSAELISPKRME